MRGAKRQVGRGSGIHRPGRDGLWWRQGRRFGQRRREPEVDPNGIVTMASGEPQNPLQPANVMESYGSDVIKSVFAQLVDYDESGKIVMENAESVTTTDSKTFTVKLKDGWTFHDGTPVTAKSYVDAWNWDAATKNNQQNASWFSDIKGYADVHPEKGELKAGPCPV